MSHMRHKIWPRANGSTTRMTAVETIVPDPNSRLETPGGAGVLDGPLRAFTLMAACGIQAMRYGLRSLRLALPPGFVISVDTRAA
jgi:hypothetical protein